MVIVRDGRLLEGIIQIQDTERGILILEDRLIRHTLLIDISRLLTHEILLIQIAFIDCPQVSQHQDSHAYHHIVRHHRSVLAGIIPEEQYRSRQDKEQRTQRIRRGQRLTIHQQGVIIPIRQLILRIISRTEIQEKARHQPEDQ